MNEPNKQKEKEEPGERGEPGEGAGAGAALRGVHRFRARSAYDRAFAACRYAGVGEDAAEAVPRDPVGRAANALRLSAGSLAALAASAPDPAADARCARNTAAAAALAAQLAAAHDSSAASASALRAALAASRAAAGAAGGSARGQDPSLNTSAEEAERHAVAMARAAGWIRTT
ncbi:hypothetical protein A6P39_021600 [Streptomyces sp. FXJ1.172]|uniref:hypothetical protein n=1 Tax=Streptomyces sp. FXJ1.172 TaxID=710705 RepID=UPI000AD25D61|nr:hypothetical protein [Streptomyces sp. FXJ1.172]WEO96416.1 hypothetical protein A6P39_021600 [Streptomyces sp. FXJ1.172]